MQLGFKKIGVIVIVIVIERKKFGYFSITFELDLNYFWISLKNKNIESYKNLQFKKNCINQEK